MEAKRAAGREGVQPDSNGYLASVRPLQRPFLPHRFAAAMSGRCGASERLNGGQAPFCAFLLPQRPDMAVSILVSSGSAP
jgi:hypothetical protein